VLDWAHPIPDCINLYAGPVGSITSAILLTTLTRCSFEDRVVLYDDVQYSGPCIWLSDEMPDMKREMCSIVRYLGRLQRSYPSHPHNALCVDDTLDEVGKFATLFSSNVGYREELKALVKALAFLDLRVQKGKWLDDFSECTVSDVAWFAALKWVFSKHPKINLADEYPCVNVWYSKMTDLE
jgi:hypothetical protein